MTSASKDPVSRLFSGLLIAVGTLMMVLCGSCGALFLGGFLISGISQPDAFGMALIPLVVGGVPALVGFGLYKAGQSLRPTRSERAALSGTQFTEDEPGAPPGGPNA